jgi:hypothetical protein
MSFDLADLAFDFPLELEDVEDVIMEDDDNNNNNYVVANDRTSFKKRTCFVNFYVFICVYCLVVYLSCLCLC